MNKKGFLLLDGLIIVIIVTSLAFFSMIAYETYYQYQSSLNRYKEKENEKLEELFSKYCDCEINDEP